jgi:CheY-like chemotaxis protein
VLRRVLVVDDNQDSANSLAKLLEMLGHDVAIANDGASAVDLAEVFRPDAIVLDVGLPVMDGHMVARRIRAEAWGRDVLLIAATGWGRADDRRRAIEAGFDHHMIKPLDLAELRNLLAEPREV